jgi:hypothetical protein
MGGDIRRSVQKQEMGGKSGNLCGIERGRSYFTLGGITDEGNGGMDTTQGHKLEGGSQKAGRDVPELPTPTPRIQLREQGLGEWIVQIEEDEQQRFKPPTQRGAREHQQEIQEKRRYLS